MKTTIQGLIVAIFVAASIQAHAQGTLVYDQQSASIPIPIQTPGVDGLDIQEDSPLVQSFIPTLSAIGFVQLEFADFPGNGNNGATAYVNLWEGSSDPRFGATLLGSTDPVYMPNGFGFSYYAGVTNFYFSTPITLTAGQTYFLQPVVSGDDPWDIITIGDTYPNGQVFEGGAGFNTDFWFREGVVPEPSTLVLIGLCSLLVFAFKILLSNHALESSMLWLSSLSNPMKYSQLLARLHLNICNSMPPFQPIFLGSCPRVCGKLGFSDLKFDDMRIPRFIQKQEAV